MPTCNDQRLMRIAVRTPTIVAVVPVVKITRCREAELVGNSRRSESISYSRPAACVIVDVNQRESRAKVPSPTTNDKQSQLRASQPLPAHGTLGVCTIASHFVDLNSPARPPASTRHSGGGG